MKIFDHVFFLTINATIEDTGENATELYGRRIYGGRLVCKGEDGVYTVITSCGHSLLVRSDNVFSAKGRVSAW